MISKGLDATEATGIKTQKRYYYVPVKSKL